MTRRRAGFDDGQGRGREAAADQLMNKLTGSTSAGRDWSQSPDLPGPRDRGLDELISERGGTSQLARDLGVARTTVQRWHNRGSTPSAGSRAKLDQLNQQVTKQHRREAAQQEWGSMAQRHGGAKGLAAAAGVSTSTANKWLSGASSPSVANQAALKRADNAWRISQAHNLTVSSDTGQPDRRVYFKTSGEANVIGREGSPPDARGRREWGGASEGMGMPGIEYNDAHGGFSNFWDAASNGDALGALDAFQEFMSTEVTDCSGYDPGRGVGVFFDNFDSFELIEDDLDDGFTEGDLW